MAETRPSFTPSLSFAGCGSESIVERPLKRSHSSSADADFFKPAAISFNPRPYNPSSASNATPTGSGRRSHAAGNHRRTIESMQQSHHVMDPHPDDPNVSFIHPPFMNFPGSHLYPNGLTYSILAENPEWFLDANDFIALDSENPTGVPYPSSLEPPRGWCPAKKRDLRERGPDGWPEGEEPRLRCTFCRRTYAGVNAKSMWRRHVFEKHKIAMSNRRDTGDRPRGRRSTKENKPVFVEDNCRKNKSDVSSPELDKDFAQPRERPRSLRGIRNRTSSGAQSLSDDELASDAMGPPPSVAIPNPISNVELSSEPLSSQIELSTPQLPAIPPSPYDPTQTPTFRHSHPSQPLEQPWRFPSPTHPLHSRQRELSLCILTRSLATPLRQARTSTDTAESAILSTPDSVPHHFSPRVLFGQDDDPFGPGLTSSPFPLSSPAPSALNLDKWLYDGSQIPFASELISNVDPLSVPEVAGLGAGSNQPPVPDEFDIFSSPFSAEFSARLASEAEKRTLLEPFEGQEVTQTSQTFDDALGSMAKDTIQHSESCSSDIIDLDRRSTPPMKRRRTVDFTS